MNIVPNSKPEKNAVKQASKLKKNVRKTGTKCKYQQLVHFRCLWYYSSSTSKCTIWNSHHTASDNKTFENNNYCNNIKNN